MNVYFSLRARQESRRQVIDPGGDSSSSSFDSSSLDTLVLAGSQAWLPLAALGLRQLVDEEGAWAWEVGSIRG